MTIVPLPPHKATAAGRVGRLAVLPLFHKLAGCRVVVAGGGGAAAWKAEVLAAAGADVAVYALALDDAFAPLLAGDLPTGRVEWHPQTWSADCLVGATLAVCDAADAVEAEAFYGAATAAGMPVNVIDKPDWSTCQFGSIVNRSPVVIGISTDGAAPILGQAIRRRIETALPPWLAEWVALAQHIRRTVGQHLAPGAARRTFWERFADRAFAGPPGPDAVAALIADGDRIAGAPAHAGGRVTLAGAGPGDAELLTLKAMRALQSADVILFDDLVATEVLEFARREAKRMLVGKRGWRKSCSQAEINSLMVRFAKAGKHVVRLKSGDPMIFGRAAEEIATLEAHGIPVTVIPGVTSAVAMAATLGVSLTNRALAHSVRFVTGHSQNGGLPEDVAWPALAEPTATTIFYMGGRMAGRIAERLIAAGLAASTPVVAVASVTRRDERRWAGTLSALCGGLDAMRLAGPVLIGVGAVFADAKKMAPAGHECPSPVEHLQPSALERTA